MHNSPTLVDKYLMFTHRCSIMSSSNRAGITSHNSIQIHYKHGEALSSSLMIYRLDNGNNTFSILCNIMCFQRVHFQHCSFLWVNKVFL